MNSIFKESVTKKDLIINVILPIMVLFGFIWWRLGFSAFLALLIIILISTGVIKLAFMITEENNKTPKKIE